MSRVNTFDTVIFTWYDARSGHRREFNTALRRGNIVITDIRGIDNWTISRGWIGDGATARQLEIDHAWAQVAFEITGKIVDDTKVTDRVLRAWSKTAGIVNMQVAGFEDLHRSFYITAFALERYGNARNFTISCVDAMGHIRSVVTRTFDMVQSQGAFTFPFSNELGQSFIFGYSEMVFQIDIHSNSFIEREPFVFEGTFSDTTSAFAISNDAGQAFKINFGFQSQDVLTIDMINSIFRLTRSGVPVSILPYIDYAGSSVLGIRQGSQTLYISEVPLSEATITFKEHLA